MDLYCKKWFIYGFIIALLYINDPIMATFWFKKQALHPKMKGLCRLIL